MAHIIVRNISPYDGEYELTEDRGLNAREWRWIKRISGYMPLTVSEGFAGDDPDLYVALAVIAMCRSGRIQSEDWSGVADTLAEAEYGSIVAHYPAAEDDANPPALTSEPNEQSPNGSLENNSSPGDPSKKSSENQDATPPATTDSSSDTSSTSAPATLAS